MSEELVVFYKALADANRLKIVGLLAGRSYSVEELAALLNLKPSTVSHHLSKVEPYKLSPHMAALELENRMGLEVKEISILEARKRRLNSREGVVITKVDPQGPAGRAGLEAGDIIYQMNNQAIRGLKEYNRILEQIQPGQEALILVRDWRTGEMGYLTMVVQ